MKKSLTLIRLCRLWFAFSMLGLSLPLGASPYQIGDITIPRKGADSPAFMPHAVFPHWKHRTRFKCFVCHDKIFKMKLGADNINMDAVRSGKFCGVCHNGKVAFAIGFDTCERCHYAPRKSP